MNTIVPLISSGVAGPLGVLHLPRLWLKVSLEQRGKLAAGYPGVGKGYDDFHFRLVKVTAVNPITKTITTLLGDLSYKRVVISNWIYHFFTYQRAIRLIITPFLRKEDKAGQKLIGSIPGRIKGKYGMHRQS